MRRGQVTAYAIIGLLVVSAVVLVIFLKDSLFRVGERVGLVRVPEQAKKVQVFTESCIGQALKDGSQLLSAQGGYIYRPVSVYPPSPLHPFSNVLSLFASGSAWVLYGVYEDVNGIQKMKIPAR